MGLTAPSIIVFEPPRGCCSPCGYRRTRPAHQEHEGAKSDLKKLVPEDAKEAIGHGLRAKRSKSGAVSFELMEMDHASLQ